MPSVYMIQGKPETFFTDEQFARMLDEKLGPDAGLYFREIADEIKNAILDDVALNPLNYCAGECDKVYETQRHYENQLDTVMETLRKLYSHLHALTEKHPKTDYGLGLCAEAMGHCDIPFKERAKKI